MQRLQMVNWDIPFLAIQLLTTNLGNPKKARKIDLAAGIEALEVNGRWLLIHRESPS